MDRPETAKEAYLWANASPPRAQWFGSSAGTIELAITLGDARRGSHQGQCDDDIAELRKVPYIAEQLSELSPPAVAEELSGYGAWDDSELQDHALNLNRMLWLACGQICDQTT